MRKLAKLKGHELSLVPKGANKRQVIVVKSDKKASAMDSSQQDAALKALKSHDPALLAEIAKAVTNTDGSTKYTPQAAQVLKAVGRMLAPFKSELSMSDLANIAQVVGLGSEDTEMSKLHQVDHVAKSHDEKAEAATPPVPAKDTNDAVQNAEHQAEKDAKKDDAGASERHAPASDFEREAPLEANESAKDEKRRDHAHGHSGHDKHRGEPVENKDIEKAEGDQQSLAAVLKAHKEVISRNEALMKEVEKHRKAADEAREYQVLESVKKTVKEDMAQVVADAEEFAPVLKSLRQLPDQSVYEAVVKSMRSANEKLVQAQKAAGLFTSIGKSAEGGETEGASAEHEIDRRVDALVVKKSEGGKAVNRARVYDHFINETEEGRKLYARYHNEERNC